MIEDAVDAVESSKLAGNTVSSEGVPDEDDDDDDDGDTRYRHL